MSEDTYMCSVCFAEFKDYGQWKRHEDSHGSTQSDQDKEKKKEK